LFTDISKDWLKKWSGKFSSTVFCSLIF